MRKRPVWHLALSRGALRPRRRVDRALPEIDQAAVFEWPADPACGARPGREPA
jgi:hypothetical protein